MREKLIEFLKTLEREIAPPPKCHHAITFARYGSDESGWNERLALQINLNGVFHCFFLDEGDLEKSAPALVAEIVDLLHRPDDGTQLGVSLGRYSS